MYRKKNKIHDLINSVKDYESLSSGKMYDLDKLPRNTVIIPDIPHDRFDLLSDWLYESTSYMDILVYLNPRGIRKSYKNNREVYLIDYIKKSYLDNL